MKPLASSIPATGGNSSPLALTINTKQAFRPLVAVVISLTVCVLIAESARAQSPVQPLSVQRVAYEYENFGYYDNAEVGEGVESPTETIVPEPPAATVVDGPAPTSTPCTTCNHRANCGKSCSHGQPWKLPQPCVLQNHGIVAGGWIQQGITFSGNNPPDGFNGPVATNDFDGEYQLNQLWLYLHRPADNGGCGWAWGGHVDMMFGTDWRFGINTGLEDRINGFHGQSYGTVIPQFYAEIAYNNLSVKLGHFAGILDYEAVPGIANPFYSHSYSYGYTVPQLVTGALANYKLSDQLAVQAGFHRGWMQFEDPNDKNDFMGGVKWLSCDKRTSIAFAISSGIQRDPVWGDQERFVYSLVAKHRFNDRFEYVLVHNVGQQERSTANGHHAEWYGLNQYFLYTINKKWSANLRVEWMRDDDGARIAGPGNIPGVRAYNGAGYAGDFYEITLGANWRPQSNLTIRPEVRFDWYDGDPGVNVAPFPFGGLDDQVTFGIDAILTF